MQAYQTPGDWCILSYYTLCPEAPDGSDRIALASADLEKGFGQVRIVDRAGRVLDTFGRTPVSSAFWHTGLWQSWSPDARYLFYQSGTGEKPSVTRRELATGRESAIADADLEGAPTGWAKPVSGMLGMLYAAGYADGQYRPEQSPIPFDDRDKHGLFEYDFDTREKRLALSVRQVLDAVPDDRLAQWDREQRQRTGNGLTLMLYCLRWSPDGKRMLFHFGNHCVDKRRGEPRILKIFTANADRSNIRLALDLCEKPGVHWSWQPDNARLVGYGPLPEASRGLALCAVDADGGNFHKIASHHSGGHPSIHPTLPHLALTDTGSQPGKIELIDLRTDETVWALEQDREWGPQTPGRNPNRVCHHPVFSRDGRSIWFNRMEGRFAQVVRVELPEEVLRP